jgi:predicted RNA polymerase sigma factor
VKDSLSWQRSTATNRIARHHRLEAVRAHLLKMAGDNEAARAGYRAAARRTTSLPERRYLEARAAQLEERAR